MSSTASKDQELDSPFSEFSSQIENLASEKKGRAAYRPALNILRNDLSSSKLQQDLIFDK